MTLENSNNYGTCLKKLSDRCNKEEALGAPDILLLPPFKVAARVTCLNFAGSESSLVFGVL